MLFLAVSCKKSAEPTGGGVPFDPTQPVVINHFTPDSGGVSTQMLIYGENFGSDAGQVEVFINDKPASVIGATGNMLYVLVPSRAGSGKVKVIVHNGDQQTEVLTESNFSYIFRPSVSTLAGFTDKDGRTSIVDGPIGTAQFEEPYWLAFDEHKNIYLLEEYRGLRMIDSALTTVTTKFRTGNGWDRPRTISFNPSFDTMYLTNDQGSWDGICTVVATKAQNFSRWSSLIYSKQCNGGDVQPQTGDYFFNSYSNGQVYKWDRTNRNSRELYRVGDNSWEFNIQFAPSGDFAYMVSKNRHYILKARYNRETRTLDAPVFFAGGINNAGYQDGVGASARFREPHQGAFDENDNFYVCDVMNHCIRKITPEGVVSTFAGRPTQWGYADGDLRDAQFDRPHGIIYDQEQGAFYIADQKNRRIRKISTE
ncbi:IPT/TIG domain-containing protein [Niabella terrae]